MPEPSKPGLFPPPWWWEVRRGDRMPIALVSKSGDVLVASGDGERSWAIVSEDHMRLLAAAPDLLEACVLALSVGEALDRPDDEDQRIYLGKSTVAALRAAMAKAKGPTR